MLKRYKKLACILTVLVMVLAIPITAMAAPTNSLVKVTGGGTINYGPIFGPDYGDIIESYSINAHQIDAEGNAEGTIQFSWHYPSGWVQNNPQNQYLVHAEVLYLVTDEASRDAWVGAVITKSNLINTDFEGEDPYPVEGATFHIRLHDGGIGNPDEIGWLQFCPTMSEHIFEKPIQDFDEMNELTNGNIMFKW